MLHCTGWLPKFRRNLMLSSPRYKASLLAAEHQKKWPHSLTVMRNRNLQTTCFHTTKAQTRSTFHVYCPFKAYSLLYVPTGITLTTLNFPHTESLRVSYDSHNKQCTFPHTAKTGISNKSAQFSL